MFEFNLRRETIAYLNADHARSKIHSPDLLLSKRPRNVDTLSEIESQSYYIHLNTKIARNGDGSISWSKMEKVGSALRNPELTPNKSPK